MYLPSFYKLKFEKYTFNTRIFGSFAIPGVLWGVWLFYPSLYNTVYTDFIPPARGVQRRFQAQEEV